MKKVKLEKGITLVALIITILVLLILAAVAISSFQENDVTAYAKDAVKQHEMAQEEEKIKLAYAEYMINKRLSEDAALKVEGATVTAIENDGWEVIFDKTKSEYKIDKDAKITYLVKIENNTVVNNETNAYPYANLVGNTLMGNNTLVNNTTGNNVGDLNDYMNQFGNSTTGNITENTMGNTTDNNVGDLNDYMNQLANSTTGNANAEANSSVYVNFVGNYLGGM